MSQFNYITSRKELHMGRAFGVHSEHDLKEQSDAQIIVSRFPVRGEGS